MKTVNFQDKDGQEITVSIGGSGYRIYVKSETVDVSIHMNDNQVIILISALQDLLESSEP